MTFLYPSFLWALAALSIPVIIHLFNFRRTTRVYFSNNRFLKQVKEVTTAKRRLKHYLILASRLLFIFFLVIAFAQPLIPAREQLGTNRNILLYIDNSESMSAPIAENARALEAALTFAQNIIDLFPADTRYKIVTNDFAPFSNSFKTKPEASDILAQIRLSPVSRTMQEVSNRLLHNASAKEVFWISDFQKSTLGLPGVTGGAPGVRLDSSIRFHLIPIALDQASNIFVDSAYLQNPFAASGERNALIVRARNDGTEEVDQLIFKLTINGVQAGTAAMDIPAGGTAETTFDLATGITGLNRATLTFNDFPVSFDNEFFLALNFTDKISVLEIKAANGVTPIEKVFGNAQVFSFRSFTAGNFNYSLLAQADLVVVNGLNSIDPSLRLALREYLNGASGSLLLVPGASPDVVSYQQFTGLSSLRPVGSQKALSDLDRPDFDNPFFENVFEERSVSLAMPKATRVLEWGNDRNAILRFKNDVPFLSRFNQGRPLFLLASPLQNNFTDFFNNGLFVPVMYRIAASGRKQENRLYYSLRESLISLPADSLYGEDPVRLVGQEEVVPSQRKTPSQLLMEIPKFSINQGLYQVVSGRDTINLIAFNPDRRESLLAQFSGEEMKNQLGNGSNISIFEAESTEQFASEIKERYLGKPLWKYAIILALVFLLAEVLLVRFLK